MYITFDHERTTVSHVQFEKKIICLEFAFSEPDILLLIVLQADNRLSDVDSTPLGVAVCWLPRRPSILATCRAQKQRRSAFCGGWRMFRRETAGNPERRVRETVSCISMA